jgi:hypothetical protein
MRQWRRCSVRDTVIRGTHTVRGSSHARTDRTYSALWHTHPKYLSDYRIDASSVTDSVACVRAVTTLEIIRRHEYAAMVQLCGTGHTWVDTDSEAYSALLHNPSPKNILTSDTSYTHCVSDAVACVARLPLAIGANGQMPLPIPGGGWAASAGVLTRTPFTST